MNWYFFSCNFAELLTSQIIFCCYRKFYIEDGVICVLWIDTVLIFPFTYGWMPFLAFLKTLGRTSSTLLSAAEASFLALFLISGVNLSVFNIEHDVCCGFVYYSFSYWTNFFLFLLSWVFVSWNSAGFWL